MAFNLTKKNQNYDLSHDLNDFNNLNDSLELLIAENQYQENKERHINTEIRIIKYLQKIGVMMKTDPKRKQEQYESRIIYLNDAEKQAQKTDEQNFEMCELSYKINPILQRRKHKTQSI